MELPLALGLSGLSAVWAWQTQVFQVFRYWDADHYFLMTQQLAAGDTVTAAAPYAYRMLAPWIVAQCCAGDIQRGFLFLNLAAGASLAVLLAWWLRGFVQSAGIRLLIVAAFALQWHAPLRFAFYYPVYIDPLFQVFLLAALIVGERLMTRSTATAGAAYAVLVAAGTYAREVMLVVPVCALAGAVVARRPSRSYAWPVLALAAGIAAYMAARVNTDPVGGYRFLDAIALHLANKPIESLALVWFIAFGPLLAVVLFDWRATLAFLSRRLDLALMPLAFVVLSYIGGHDTERYLFWAMPVVYLLIAQSLERHRALVSAPLLAGLLIASQALSQRVFWPVPDPGTAVAPLAEAVSLPAQLYAIANRVFVIDDFHWNLWSNFGSRPFHLVQLGFYVAVSGAIVLLLQRRSRGRADARSYESGVVAQ